MGARESAETRQALELVRQGLTPTEAARKCGLATTTVTRAMKRHEIRWKRVVVVMEGRKVGT